MCCQSSTGRRGEAIAGDTSRLEPMARERIGSHPRGVAGAAGSPGSSDFGKPPAMRDARNVSRALGVWNSKLPFPFGTSCLPANGRSGERHRVAPAAGAIGNDASRWERSPWRKRMRSDHVMLASGHAIRCAACPPPSSPLPYLERYRMTPPRPRLVDVDLVVAQYLLGRTRLVQVLCPASRNLYFR